VSTAQEERQKWESEDLAVKEVHFILRAQFVSVALPDQDTMGQMRKKPQPQGGGLDHSFTPLEPGFRRKTVEHVVWAALDRISRP
jgi:hypothetical protein